MALYRTAVDGSESNPSHWSLWMSSTKKLQRRIAKLIDSQHALPSRRKSVLGAQWWRQLGMTATSDSDEPCSREADAAPPCGACVHVSGTIPDRLKQEAS